MRPDLAEQHRQPPGHADLRSREQRRERRAIVSSGAAIGSRLLSAGISIVSIPLTIGYLGTERFGLWAALSATTAFLAFVDLGLGNGLVNMVSMSEGREDRDLARKAVSTASIMLAAVAALLIAATLLLYPGFPWATIFNTTDELAANELGPAVAAFVILFAVGLPMSVVDRTRLGLQEAYVSSAWVAVGTLGTLAGVLVAVRNEVPLPQLVLLTSAPPVLAMTFNWVHLFVIQRPELRPTPGSVDARLAPRLVRLGFLFLALQIAVSVAYQSDVIITSNVLGPEQATTYSVTSRVFLLVPGLIAIVLAMLWPAYGEAIERGDIEWVVKTLRRSVVGAIALSAAASTALLILSPFIIALLTDSRVQAHAGLLLGMALWAVVSSAFTAVSMVLNAAGILLFQVVVALTMAFASILLSYALAHLLGVAGVIWGTLLAYVLFSGVPTAAYLPRFVRGLRRRPMVGGLL